MKRTVILLFAFFIASSDISTVAQQTLCTPKPSKEAVALYRYLLDMKGKKILSGQMSAPWGINELEYLQTNTGKQPAINGVDFINPKDNPKEVQNAIDWWKSGGITTIMWHMGAPGIGQGYENSKKAIDIDKVFQEGTPEYTAFWSELKIKADMLTTIRDANVPVLWRPFHELNGNWFWWGKQGPEKFKKLWITMFDYFVKERGLNNLIWVLCYTGEPDAKWYPGDEYVDIAGADTYAKNDSPQMTMYNTVKTITGDKFPIAFHECGIPPNPDQCLKQGVMWSWWMEWHTSHLQGIDKTYLKYVYDHDLVITRDELPDIMAQYGWNENCKVSVIVPQIKTGKGKWQQSNRIPAGSGIKVKCRIQVSDRGKLRWSGYGTSGSSSKQTVTVIGNGTITVTFKNKCGATSTQTFNIVDADISPSLSPGIPVIGGI